MPITTPITTPISDTMGLPNQAQDISLDGFKMGQEARFTWHASLEKIDSFANLSGDKNPLHMDDEYARHNGFDGRVVHGFLLGAQISGLIGMMLPGKRCLLLEEKLAFPHAVYAGDHINFYGKVIKVHLDLALVILKVSAKKEDHTVLRGQVTCQILS